MARKYEGFSNAREDADAGFRAATKDAVAKFKADHGSAKSGAPVRLKVTDMYVEWQNPIHGYIVVLEPEG